MSVVESISHPVISALSWSVMHAIWQFSIIMGLCFIAMKLLARSRAAVRHNLALTALAAMPVTFLLTFFRQYNVYRDAKMIVSLEFDNLSLAASSGGSPIFIVNKDMPLLLDRIEPYLPFIFWFYMIGLVFFSLNGMFGYMRLKSMRKRYIQPLPKEWIEKLRQFSARAGVSGVHTYLSSKIDVPLVAGMIKPVILLPVSMLTALSPEQVETIILHELRHIRNNDHYINMFQNLVEIVFFFHPATWYISKQLRAEREKRVDEWVVGESKSPLPYAQALLHLEQNRGHALQPALAATQSKNLLLTRIKNIMTMKTRSFNPGKNLAALLTIIAAVLMLAWYDPALGVSYYQMDEPGQHVFYDNVNTIAPAQLLAMATPETAEDTPPAVNQEEEPNRNGEQNQVKEPKKVYFHDGSSMSWEALSEDDRNEINKAIEEARLAITEVNREVLEQFQSEEFRQQMQQVQEDIRKAMEEVNIEINNHMHSEEFKRDMQQAREEVRRAMEEVNREVHEEFRSEAFQEEMRKAREELREAIQEMEQVDWDAFGEELNATMKELGHTLEQIGPIVNETVRELNLDELLREVMEAIEEAAEPSQEKQEEEKPGK